MSALIPFLTLDQTCEQVLVWINGKLTYAGFRVVQTFDLHVARLAHPDCPCPHHGTADCDCQMVILLVYRKQDAPATLVIHGQDGKTWLSFATPVEMHSHQHLESSVRHMLIPRHPSPPSSVEATYETRSTV